MKFGKRSLSLLLAVLVLVMSVPFSGFTVAANEVSAGVIYKDIPATAVIENEGDIAVFEFTPEESGVYVFKSFAEEDTYGYICDEFGNTLTTNDDGGENGDFKAVYGLLAGVTYKLRAKYWSSQKTGSFEVSVSRGKYGSDDTKSPVVSVEVPTITLIKNVNGYYRTDDIWDKEKEEWIQSPEYFYYHTDPSGMVITLEDGSIIENTGFFWNDDWYGVMHFYNQDYQNQWTVGNTYEVLGTIAGFDFTYEIQIVEGPVEAITVEPVLKIENTGGYYRTDDIWDEEAGEWTQSPEYFFYHIDPSNMVITLEDGRVIEGTSFDWNDTWYYTNYSHKQSYENQWTAGNTYEVEGSIAGFDFTFEVEIVECPVESVTVEPIIKIENIDGYSTTDSNWDEEREENVETPEYFYYNDLYPYNAVITLKDGTVIEGTSFEWNGESYGIGCYSNQSYENRWTVGNTYKANGDIAGYEFTYDVKIVECPIESVTVEPLKNIENINGYFRTGEIWDEELGEWVQTDEYFHYYDIRPSSEKIVITLKDGTKIEDTGFEWNGTWYEVNYEDQSYENRLELGKNEISASILGYDFTYELEIVKSPVESVTVEPLQKIENTDGYFRTDSIWDEDLGEWVQTDEYFYYFDTYPSWEKIVITLKDGTIIEDSGFEWNNTWYSFDYQEQSYENRLVLGKNDISASIAGFDFTYELEIIDTPIESVTVEPIVKIENTDGYFTTSGIWDEELEEWVQSEEYFHYYDMNPKSVVITLKDGRVINDTYFEWNGTWHGISYASQSYENRLELGKNEISASILGYDFTYEIEIIDTPIESVTVEPIILIENTNGYLRTDVVWDDELEEYVETPEYFYYYDTHPQGVVITLKDGTIIKGSNFEWNGEWHSLQIYGEQNYENRLQLGSNIREASVLGYHFTYDVQVAQIASNDSFEFVQNSDGIVITDSFIHPETLEIPAEINGLPVMSVAGLSGNAITKNIIFPDSVKTVGDYIISNFCNLESVTYGSGITNLSADMFIFSENLKEITVSEDNPFFATNDGALYNKDVTEVIAYPIKKGNVYNVPDTVKQINALGYAIYDGVEIVFSENNPYFRTVDGVTYNAEMTKVLFCSKSKEGSYTMPESVTEIAESAFKDCNKLTEVIVSSKVSNIVYCVFASCKSLKNVDLPSGLVSIGDMAFMETDSLESVDLPENLESIGESAFRSSGLTSLSLPDSVKIIGTSAFKDSKLTSLNLGNGIEEIYASAFQNTPVTSVVLPNSLTWLGSFAFDGCKQLKSVTFGSGLQSVSDWCFASTGLESVTIPATITYIGENAFQRSQIKTLDLGAVVEICEGAFGACDNLKKVIIPNSVTTIGIYAFNSCDSLKTVVIGDSVEFLGTGAFASCPITSLKLGEAMPVIPPSAFAVTDITTVSIPNSVTDIMYYSFYDCSELVSVELPLSVQSIEYGAFEHCEKLSDVYYEGTKSDRANINIEDNNEYLEDAKWHYNSCGKDAHVYTGDCDEICENCDWVRASAADHDYANATCKAPKTCKVCGATSGNHLSHKSDNGTVTKKATCAATGTKTYKCTACKDVIKTETIAKLAHKSDNGTVTKNATCKATGTKTYKCTACKDVIKTETIAKLAHKSDNGTVTKKATCKATGTKTYKCTACKATIKTDTIAKTAHDYDSGKVTKKATCKATGVKTYTCSVCKDTKTETIKKSTTHSYTTTTTKATTSKDGKIVKACSVCDKVSSTTTIYYAKSFSLSKTSYTYNGKVQKPSVTVKDSKGKTISSSNYTVTYSSGLKNAGTYTVTVTMKGNYSGTKKLTYKINPIDVSKCKISLSKTSYTYNGKVQKPTVTVKDSKGKTISSSNYTVSYSGDCKKVGTYTVTIKMKGNYSGTTKLTFKINPTETKITKVTGGKKSVTVNIFKKTKEVTGYEIQYSTSKSFSKATTKTISKNSTTKYTIKSLSAKKTYYVRVRTYKTVNGKKYYSGWSTVKSVKTK